MEDLLKVFFKSFLAQTSDFYPIQLEIEKAEGIYLYDKNGKQYIDLTSGVAVNNLGHKHPKIIEAIKRQTEKYLHLMVYGEFVQEETIKLAKKLAELLPPELSTSFFVNSGSEAIEGAIKLAKLHTGRNEVISFNGSYHGSTLATLNMLGDEFFKRPFRPLIPDFKQLEFNCISQLSEISKNTACVVLEPIQTASGMITPDAEFLKKLKERCVETETLLIFDEIQTALGRTGNLFAFETFGIQPDILCLAKSLGAGLPIGAFISSSVIMHSLNNGHPLLGHATTFGGHPLSCATALAGLEVLSSENYVKDVQEKSELFRKYLKHPLIKEIRGYGLLLAVELEDERTCREFVAKAIPGGIITYWFLFNKTSFSIIPPLTITNEKIKESCSLILEILNKL